MRRKRRKGDIGFSNERFLKLLSDLTGITPVGELGRETPLDLTSLESARGSLLMRELFSKYDDGKPSPEKEERTWKRFHDAERSCEDANQRVRKWVWTEQPYWLSVRARIRNVLGRFSWDECARNFGHGPGATTRLTRDQSYRAYKYSGRPETTPGNAVLARCAIAHKPLWIQSIRSSGEDPEQDLVSLVPGNSVICVPKNYKTWRTIAKEPDMNVYVQKGIGGCIRRRLKRVGVDLDDQSLNQRAAREGSITGALATIDLSMASDTLAKELVGWLLPLEWWEALEMCRSPFGVLPSGKQICYQKFSSMGNGYTFELESLIFWAIVQSCVSLDPNEMDTSVRVYGDDLVVPSPIVDRLYDRLQEAGFTPNPEKSWSSGPYRESCGKHYYHGADITPFYVRKPVKALDKLFLAHNNLFRWGERTGVEVRAVLTKLRQLAPAKWREPRLPDGYGDGAFISFVDELQMNSHPHGWEFWQVKALTRTTIELSSNDLPSGQLLASLEANAIDVASEVLRGLGLREPLSGLPVKEGKYREVKILIPHRPLP